ncbi:MAG TPA: class I adenylate-forming enzyme family protein [Jatrophihabitantaceae bacterium]|nr:class I adenylate-forming enzyme family protein [Jatrophihabitantaceae bacterium]
MIELLRRAALVDDPRPAIITNDREVSYPQLVAESHAVASALLHRGITRFGIVDDDAARIVALLAGASLAGAEACVYPPVHSVDEALELAGRFDHDVLVSERTDIDSDDIDVLCIADLVAGGSASVPEAPPRSRPLLVLTTGTTGLPRGARQDWSRVVRPFLGLRAEPSERWLLAYGLHQFGGLQLLLHVLGEGATVVAPTPRRPREGIVAMRRFGVRHASATPTYWRFVVAELRSDGGEVPPLQQITLSGEAVQSRLLDELTSMFPGARVSQIYGANESGTLRSVRDNRNGLPLSALTEDPDADIAIKIVDGELWVRSRIGMLGYYGEPPIDPDAWRPTGDLVEIVGDRVKFRGRATEIINVGGVKVHPLPIEERISAIDGVQFVRVFGRTNALSGSIVAVEIVASADADATKLDEAVRAACADLPRAARPRSIKFVDTVETTGNKVTRGARA